MAQRTSKSVIEVQQSAHHRSRMTALRVVQPIPPPSVLDDLVRLHEVVEGLSPALSLGRIVLDAELFVSTLRDRELRVVQDRVGDDLAAFERYLQFTNRAEELLLRVQVRIFLHHGIVYDAGQVPDVMLGMEPVPARFVKMMVLQVEILHRTERGVLGMESDGLRSVFDGGDGVVQVRIPDTRQDELRVVRIDALEFSERRVACVVVRVMGTTVIVELVPQTTAHGDVEDDDLLAFHQILHVCVPLVGWIELLALYSPK